jgi:hypothetical protein
MGEKEMNFEQYLVEVIIEWFKTDVPAIPEWYTKNKFRLKFVREYQIPKASCRVDLAVLFDDAPFFVWEVKASSSKANIMRAYEQCLEYREKLPKNCYIFMAFPVSPDEETDVADSMKHIARQAYDNNILVDFIDPVSRRVKEFPLYKKWRGEV